MKFALVNPQWSFKGSTYFGCPDPHFPLELLSARQFLRAEGHQVLLVDAHMKGLGIEEVRSAVAEFRPDFLVVPTAPSYLFWRCPQPELRIPAEWIGALRGNARAVIVGPHSSATPRAALNKTGADVALRGEPDQILAQLAGSPWEMIEGCCWKDADGRIHLNESLGVTNMQALEAIDFGDYSVEKHRHLHHIFPGHGADHLRQGAELEFARGCPYSCTFCNKTLFRNKFRERKLDAVLAEVDALIARGVDYIYFIDEIFGVGKQVRALLDEIAERPVSIGFQSRIDLWNEESLAALERAHCVSFECGIESITEEGRDELHKNCRLDTDRIQELLIQARKHIPWVQANLIRTNKDAPHKVAEFQNCLKTHGVWVSEPVPMFPFPGSPLYVETFGVVPDDCAWERAHEFYLREFGHDGYSDIQDQRPRPLAELECAS